MKLDRYGRGWPDNFEVCPECGQPDNCGDCNHQPLSPDDVEELGGEVMKTFIVEMASDFIPPIHRWEEEVQAETAEDAKNLAPRGIVVSVRVKS